ncbi:glycosyl transferase [Almyronema epifaneia]|uniref:Glycosyl transferase n=1 Tax=Almyronema epifaneia S1 TaxID=2991925 RepID=A0ABW6IJ40_9CYAN
MPLPSLYVAITNHGFGHATRAASVAAAIQTRCPALRIILTTTAPAWLLQSYLPHAFEQRLQAYDVGVIQSDSMTMNYAETLVQLQKIRAQQDEIIQAEVEFIKANQVGLILADIPPLAAPIAQAAGIPCWMMSNFGWDFIYRPWGGAFVEIADWIVDCFKQCDRLFRLPFHEAMSAFGQKVDVGLTGGSPHYSEAELRDRFDIKTPKNQTILLSFGGLGLQKIPYATLQQFPERTFISFDRNAPELPNLRRIIDRQYRPIDFMPLCDRVVSKPGFSTFSEACRLGVPVATLTRQGFAESALLVEGIQDAACHQIIEPNSFFAGDWDFLRQTPHPPRQSQPIRVDGNDAIAEAVVSYLT